MASVLQVKVIGGAEAIRHINGIIERLPRTVDEASQEFGESLQRSIKREITVKRLKATERLWKSIKWVQNKGEGHLNIVKYGVELDTQATHPVAVRPGSKLWRWAFLQGEFGKHHDTTAPFPRLKRKLLRTKTMTLHPHPFIEAPVRRAITRFSRPLQRRVAETVRSRGAR